MEYLKKTFTVSLGSKKYSSNWARAFGLCPVCEKKEDKCVCPEEDLLTDEDLNMIEEAQRLVLDFFKGDVDKATLWFKIENPMLGNVSPSDMIKCGRIKKLLRFIKTSVDGEGP